MEIKLTLFNMVKFIFTHKREGNGNRKRIHILLGAERNLIGQIIIFIQLYVVINNYKDRMRVPPF